MSNDSKAATFAVYRVGDVGDDMTPALRRVLEVHQKQHGCPLVGLVVNKPLMCKARQALDTLGLPSLEVKGNGGCLAWEVWLAEGGNGNGRRPSLVARVEAETQTMLPDRARQLVLELEEVTV